MPATHVHDRRLGSDARATQLVGEGHHRVAPVERRDDRTVPAEMTAQLPADTPRRAGDGNHAALQQPVGEFDFADHGYAA